jgi:thiosulfate dehydrogenase (quinone) large subunit
VRYRKIARPAALCPWPANNPFLDEHAVYAVILAGIAYVGAGRWLGLGDKWRGTGLVGRPPILE